MELEEPIDPKLILKVAFHIHAGTLDRFSLSLSSQGDLTLIGKVMAAAQNEGYIQTGPEGWEPTKLFYDIIGASINPLPPASSDETHIPGVHWD